MPTSKKETSSLHISMDPQIIADFVKGYEEDPTMRKAKAEAPDNKEVLTAEHRFYVSDNGLLVFRDADWKARLCVPRSMVPSILALAHESPAESAHAGSARLHRRLAERFYWSDMWKDVQQFC